jgi:hypothetical protein
MSHTLILEEVSQFNPPKIKTYERFRIKIKPDQTHNPN